MAANPAAAADRHLLPSVQRHRGAGITVASQEKDCPRAGRAAFQAAGPRRDRPAPCSRDNDLTRRPTLVDPEYKKRPGYAKLIAAMKERAESTR